MATIDAEDQTGAARKGLSEPMLGALLRSAAEASRRVLFARLRAAGYDDLRDAHQALFKYPGPDGMRPTDLARHVGLSKQALNPLLNDLETAGYLTRETTDDDGRHRVLSLTERGESLLSDAEAILHDIEVELARNLGPRRYATFRAVLSALPAVLDQQAPPSD